MYMFQFHSRDGVAGIGPALQFSPVTEIREIVTAKCTFTLMTYYYVNYGRPA